MFALEHRLTAKSLFVCSSILLGASPPPQKKRLERPPHLHPLENCLLLDPPPFPQNFRCPQCVGRGGGYGYFLELHIILDITKTSSSNCLIFTSVSVDSSPRSYLSTSATVRIPVHTATKSGRNLSGIYWRIHFQDRWGASSQCYRNRAEITVL